MRSTIRMEAIVNRLCLQLPDGTEARELGLLADLPRE